MASGSEVQQDPGGAQEAVNRYRDLAKYIVTIFAAIGALLAAGTQLSSLGQLDLDDDIDRLVAAGIALAVAIACVALIVWRALSVLRPIEMSLDDIVKNKHLRTEVNKRPDLLLGCHDVQQLRDEIDNELLDDDERAGWLAAAMPVIEFGAVETARRRFKWAWVNMLWAGALAAAAIAVFAWAANPPKDPDPASASPVVQPTPVEVRFQLTEEGRETLRGALGRGCVKRPIRALSIGGKRGQPHVVTLPAKGCRLAQFTVSPTFAAALGANRAPALKPKPEAAPKQETAREQQAVPEP